MNLLYHKILVLVKRFFRKITKNEKNNEAPRVAEDIQGEEVGTEFITQIGYYISGEGFGRICLSAYRSAPAYE